MNSNILNKKILIVDDEKSLLTMMKVILNKEGFNHVILAENGNSALKLSKIENPDLVILDIMLPDIEGYEVCSKIRMNSMVPIIFLSAKDSEVDRLVSFAVGGDDFVSKPFSTSELTARIKAALYRANYYASLDSRKSIVYFGDYKLDLNKRELFCKKEHVNLTLKEYLLLEYMVINSGITLSREKIIENVWDSNYEGFDNTVSVHIRHLREKVEENPSSPKWIITVKGRGYRFDLKGNRFDE